MKKGSEHVKVDDNEFYELMNKKKSMLYKIAYSYVRNEEDALDIVSETFYKAYISIDKLKNPEYLNTWVTRILINCSMDFLKKHKRETICEDVQDKEENEDDLREDILDLKNAVYKLNYKYRTVIILKYFEDMSIPQISEVLSMPAGTVKTYIHKALSELKINLEGAEIYE